MASKRRREQQLPGRRWQHQKAPQQLYADQIREALGRGGKPLTAMRRAIEAHGAGVLGEPDERVWVWSDLHLGHANIIEYQHRPYPSVHAMDADLWWGWHEASARDRTVVCVGDIALSDAVCAATWERIGALPGSQVLVVGNHDVGGSGRLRVEGFRRVKAVLTSLGDPPLIWTHAPLPDVPDGHVNIHGHQHATPPGKGRHINVSVEQLDYRPIRLDRLRRLARALVDGGVPPGATTLERVRGLEQIRAAVEDG